MWRHLGIDQDPVLFVVEGFVSVGDERSHQRNRCRPRHERDDKRNGRLSLGRAPRETKNEQKDAHWENEANPGEPAKTRQDAGSRKN